MIFLFYFLSFFLCLKKNVTPRRNSAKIPYMLRSTTTFSLTPSQNSVTAFFFFSPALLSLFSTSQLLSVSFRGISVASRTTLNTTQFLHSEYIHFCMFFTKHKIKLSCKVSFFSIFPKREEFFISRLRTK